MVRDIRIELMTPTWKDGVLPLYKSRENGGQSGERSQRARKRRIYSPNRLLNGIPTHMKNWWTVEDSNFLKVLSNYHDDRQLSPATPAHEIGQDERIRTFIFLAPN